MSDDQTTPERAELVERPDADGVRDDEVVLEHLLQTGLVDRDVAAAEPRDPLLVHVADHHVVPHLRETRSGHEAYVAGAEYSHAHGLSPLCFRLSVR